VLVPVPVPVPVRIEEFVLSGAGIFAMMRRCLPAKRHGFAAWRDLPLVRCYLDVSPGNQGTIRSRQTTTMTMTEEVT